MNPGKPKNRTLEPRGLLTVGQVAGLAGVSTDTIRSWERKGLLKAQRTPGGQRRFDRAEIEEFVRQRSPQTRQQSTPIPDEFDEPQLNPTEDSTGSLVPGPVSTILHSEDPLLTEARAESEAIRAEHIGRVTEARLTELKTYGYGFAGGVPAEWRAQVARDLEEFVTARQFPAYLSQLEASEFILSRVNQTLKPYRDQTAGKATVRRLVDSGVFHSKIKTFSWSYDEGKQAEREVRRELERRVRTDWTEAEVRDLVGNFLKRWRMTHAQQESPSTGESVGEEDEGPYADDEFEDEDERDDDDDEWEDDEDWEDEQD